ncbi:MAG TPA: nucleoside phosphorylase [Bacteroidales bacterium]|nr:nucleoside phosphorylase [Bacteroidales bacterium]HRR93930.1 nucleoside phosphorylase [Bacteroidales bacterium]
MKKTELITNSDGSVFHLHLKPGDISDRIIIVGDPGRVGFLAELFDEIRVQKENREFRTVTGYYKGSEITVISSGIGTDNIDILVNELDALVNINLQTGEVSDNPVSLSFIRIGTSGGIREDVPVGSYVLSETAVGFDGLLHFYEGYDWLLDTALADMLADYLEWPDTLSYPYAVKASKELMELFQNENFIRGITVSAPGFYAPQGRVLRLGTFDNEINRKLSEFSLRGKTITNYEMESSALYGLSGLLGHRALTVCAVIGNRVTGEFMNDYQPLIRDLAVKIMENF